jgi:hypothetical protein
MIGQVVLFYLNKIEMNWNREYRIIYFSTFLNSKGVEIEEFK